MLSMTFSTRFTPFSSKRKSREEVSFTQEKPKCRLSLLSKVFEVDEGNWEKNKDSMSGHKK